MQAFRKAKYFWFIGILLSVLFTHSSTLCGQDQIGTNLGTFQSSRYCGYSVATSADGTRVAYGCTLDNTGGAFAGAVIVMDLANGSWVPAGSPIAGAANDRSGWSSAMSSDGNVIVIGGPSNAVNGNNAGVARVYSYDGTDWSQIGSDILGPSALDRFGSSVAISADGSTIAVGAPEAYLSNPARSGMAEVYRVVADDWVKVGNTVFGVDQWAQAGASVGLSADGSRLIVGSNQFHLAGYSRGMVEVFDLNNGTWELVGSPLIGPAQNDNFGTSVSITDGGSRIAVGNPWHDAAGNNKGAVFVYDWAGADWALAGSKINGIGSSTAFFGSNVKLSGTGEYLVGAAEFGSGPYLGVGHVRVFEFQNNSWVQKGATLTGDDTYDYYGKGVDISDDGNTVMIGAPQNDQYGNNAGKAQAFSFLQVLPVEYLRFSGLALAKTIQLTWETLSEENNSGFEIQRKNQLFEWETIGSIPANDREAAVYTYLDLRPIHGDNTYRLKQLDYSGESTYSEMISVPFYASASEKILVTPNPITGNLLHAQLTASGSKNYRLIDLSGKTILTGNTQSETLEVRLAVRPGIYLLYVEMAGQTWTSKVIVLQ